MKTIATLYMVLATIFSADATTIILDTTTTENNLIIEIINVVNPTCNGLNNGSVQTNVKGGKAPYSYNWNTFPAQYTPNAINLSAGIYFLEVRDAENNVVYHSVEIKDPISIVASGPTSLEISDANPTVNSDFKFDYFVNNQNADATELNSFKPGIYDLVIISDNGCVVELIVQVYASENESVNFDAEITSVQSALQENIVLQQNE